MFRFSVLCGKMTLLVLAFLAFRRAFLDGGSGALMSTSSSAVMVVGSRFRFLDKGNGEVDELMESSILCLTPHFLVSTSRFNQFLNPELLLWKFRLIT